jgi:hypothetical protein
VILGFQSREEEQEEQEEQSAGRRCY